jgi:hypothetical protein
MALETEEWSTFFQLRRDGQVGIGPSGPEDVYKPAGRVISGF